MNTTIFAPRGTFARRRRVPSPRCLLWGATGAQHLQPQPKGTPMTPQQETLFRELVVVALEALAQGRQGAAQDAIRELRALTEA